MALGAGCSAADGTGATEPALIEVHALAALTEVIMLSAGRRVLSLRMLSLRAGAADGAASAGGAAPEGGADLAAAASSSPYELYLTPE